MREVEREVEFESTKQAGPTQIGQATRPVLQVRDESWGAQTRSSRWAGLERAVLQGTALVQRCLSLLELTGPRLCVYVCMCVYDGMCV